MPFTIVAERGGVNTYNRRSAAREALFLASSRVQDGAEKVEVFDERGQFISAPILADAARNEIGAVKAVQKAVDAAVAELLTLKPQPYTATSGLTIEVKAEPPTEARVSEPVDPDIKSVKPGRVRVFRAGGKRD